MIIDCDYWQMQTEEERPPESPLLEVAEPLSREGSPKPNEDLMQRPADSPPMPGTPDGRGKKRVPAVLRHILLIDVISQIV